MATIHVYNEPFVAGLLSEGGFEKKPLSEKFYIIQPKKDGKFPVGEYFKDTGGSAKIIIGDDIDIYLPDFKKFLDVLSQCYASGCIKIVA